MEKDEKWDKLTDKEKVEKLASLSSFIITQRQIVHFNPQSFRDIEKVINSLDTLEIFVKNKMREIADKELKNEK